MNDRWFIRHHEGLEPLPIRKKPCSDCAVICGMYKDHSDALKECLDSTKDFVSKRWFCHSNIKLACRGNFDNIYEKKENL